MADSAQNVTQAAAPLYATPHVVRLQLTDFRSYESLNLNCDLAPVALSGENGAGKTNILESISMLGPGRGLRRAHFDDLARKNGKGGWAVAAYQYRPPPPNRPCHFCGQDRQNGRAVSRAPGQA